MKALAPTALRRQYLVIIGEMRGKTPVLSTMSLNVYIHVPCTLDNCSTDLFSVQTQPLKDFSEFFFSSPFPSRGCSHSLNPLDLQNQP